MSPKSKKKKHGKQIVLLLLLALLCIGGTELLVCRYVAPDLYTQITTPVKEAAGQVLEMGESLLERAKALSPAPEEEVEEEEPPENQLAGEPALENSQPREDPTITEFAQRSGVEILTGGNIEMVYYNQGEDPWVNAPYGPDRIGGYGCGPTVMAMLVSSLTDQMVDPATMAQWAYEQGYCAAGSGSYNSLMPGVAETYGLNLQTWTDLSAQGLSQALASGHVFVALMTRGHFTARGHFILLRGLTLEGNVLVADPNSRERSLTAWDPQLIIDELSASRNSGAPLWCFSTFSSF